jgi:hypothetical protein
MMEELKDIIGGLEQRIHVYKNRLQELQKKRDRLDEEVRTIKKYLELAETLYRVELDKAKLANLSTQIINDAEKDKNTKSSMPIPILVDVTDQSRELLLGKSKYAGMSVPQAALTLLKEAGRPMHAKDIYLKLLEGGVRIRGKTPVTSVAISLKRDKRFRKVAPNTFELVEERILQSA